LLCCVAWRSQPIILISASFDTSAVKVDTTQSTRAVARPTSLWHPMFIGVNSTCGHQWRMERCSAG
jgi:hypothetical protein